jgi:hypothetical protein
MGKSILPLACNIALSAWIIRDGNYPDFSKGEVVEFAVEYYQQPRTAITHAMKISG